MTCIVGLLHAGGSIVAADSTIVDEDERLLDPGKIRRAWGLVAGFAGHAGRCDVALYLACPSCRVPLLRWLREQYVPRLAEALGRPRTKLGSLYGLFATATDLAIVGPDGTALLPLGHYAAIGGSASYALGSLWTSEGLGWSPRDRVVSALAASANHHTGTGAPWRILEIQR